MLSLIQIRDLVGPAAFLRGRTYADAGQVEQYDVEPFTGGVTVSGLVQGAQLEPYEVEVDLVEEHGRLEPVEGDCTCPVGLDCKHVAALLIHVSARLGRPEAPGEPPAPAQPLWEQALRPFLVPPPDVRPPVALQFELIDGGTKGHALTMRPVLRGAKGRWIRTGISWSNLTYHQSRRHAPGAFRLLDEIAALVTASERTYYYSQPQTVDLVTFPSPRIWSVLDAARDAGLPLVRSGAAGTPVLLDPEPAEVIVDVTGSASLWQLEAYFSADGRRLAPRTFVLLGAPGHGIVRWEPGAPDSPLRLARLRAPLADGVQSLVMHRGGIQVPEAEIEGFLRDGYPVLRRRVTLQSSDGSVELPTPAPPRLAIRAAYGAQRTVDVDWVWRYPLGQVVREIPFGGPPDLDGDPDRDPDAEAKLVVEACATADALPVLLDGDPSEPRLAVRVRLRGDDAIIGLSHVLAALGELPGFDVERSGDVPQLRAASSAPRIDVGGEVFDGDWFDLQVEVTVDGESIPFAELFTAVAEDQKYLILPSGTYVGLDRPELRRLAEIIAEAQALAEPSGNATARVSRFQLSIWDDLRGISGEPELASAQAREWIARVHSASGLASVDDVEVPASLRATLRPYQHKGFAWLAFLYSHRLGGVLADDMGLGKTVQAIALMCHVREAEPAGDPFLVVAPTSVVGNWAAELGRFAPHLRVAVITATQARRGDVLAAAVAGADVVVTSYALLRLEHEEYADLPWAALLLDEAQQVKNHNAKGYRCARTLPAPVKFAITGTPMENNLLELWATYSIVAPGLLGDVRRFGEHFRVPVERGKDPERLAQLRRRIAPLMLRRRKEEVAAELPPKIEQVVSLQLVPKHRRVYDTLLARERQKVLGLLTDLDRNRIEILRSLTLLRQAALDPSLVDPAHAGVPATKLDALLDSLEAIVAEGHRVLVFSQFTRFLGRVRDRLDAAGLGYCYLDGRTRNRPEVVQSFNEGAAPVFLLSLKAGGVGLNLTQADYCILLDPWWNPATEAQAVDRAHRIGQTRTVMVYRLVAKDTIEEKVMALKATKARLIAGVLDGGDGSSAALTAEDIRALLG